VEKKLRGGRTRRIRTPKSVGKEEPDWGELNAETAGEPRNTEETNAPSLPPERKPAASDYTGEGEKAVETRKKTLPTDTEKTVRHRGRERGQHSPERSRDLR